MKNILTTIAIGLAMLNAKANHFSALNLQLFDHGNFSVMLDNQPASNSNYFSAAHIQPGRHHLEVFRFSSVPYGYSMVRKELYNGWINLPPKSVLYAQVEGNGQLDVMKVVPNYYTGNGYGNGWSNDEDYNYGYDNSYGNDYSNGTNCDYEGNGWNNPAPQAPIYMQQMEFMQLKQSISSKNFESSKLQIAKQALAYNYFSSAEIADLLSVFSFESSKLDIAKCAYAKVIDKQNYYLVNNAFSFESSIQELNQFIAGK